MDNWLFLILTMPKPIMRVPGSIPKIILEPVCTRRFIFGSRGAAKQKYQINNQLCPGAGRISSARLHRLQADAVTTWMAAVSADTSPGDCRRGSMENLAGHFIDGPELGPGGQEMAAVDQAGAGTVALAIADGYIDWCDIGILYAKPHRGIFWTHALSAR